MNNNNNNNVSANIALLIDADNVNVENARQTMEFLSKRGRLAVRRIYGNWSKQVLKPWANFIRDYGFAAIQQFDFVKGKNITDMALTVDAMDILRFGNIDIFALLSGDSDYVPLAAYLRERGCRVIGFGSGNTNDAYRNFLDEFYVLDTLTDYDKQSMKSGGSLVLAVHNAKEERLAKIHRCIYQMAAEWLSQGKGDEKQRLFCTSFAKALSSVTIDNVPLSFNEYGPGGFWGFIQKFPKLYSTVDLKGKGRRFSCLSPLNVVIVQHNDENIASDNIDNDGAILTRAAEIPSAEPFGYDDNDGATLVASDDAKGDAVYREHAANMGNYIVGNSYRNDAEDENGFSFDDVLLDTKFDIAIASHNEKLNEQPMLKNTVVNTVKTEKTAPSDMVKKGGRKIIARDLTNQIDKTGNNHYEPHFILRQLYLRSNRSMAEAAKASGISAASLCRYTKGKGFPKEDALEKLAKFFGVTAAFIRGERPIDEYRDLVR